MHNPLIVALDVSEVGAAVELARQVGSHVGAVKIGSELFTTGGPEIVRQMRSSGASVFLDLKFHDIPNTVAKAVAAAVRLDVQMLTVHTCGGAEMLAAAERSAQETAAALGRPAPLVLGVTVLTSMNAEQLATVTLETQVERQVERLARLATAAGLRGLVCSPLELPLLRGVLPASVQLVTPGIRTEPPRPGDDQKRTLGPAEALARGANWLVVGRPIYAAPDPAAAAAAILARCHGEAR